MSVDRTKVLEAAQKHLAKGAFDKAIVELQKLVKADPSDVRTWLKIGDLHVKLNQRPQAIDTYSRVADQYAGQGFFHKAVAVYKQILNLDPTRLDAKLKLAEMNESMQLTSDAMATYEQVAAEYGRLGDAERALSTFGKMVALDPTNIPTRIKYAEALSRAGKNAEAADAFEAGAELLKKQGRIDDYLKVVERLLFHREDVDRARELAQLYLERNDGKRALAKLQVLFKADPRHVPTLELLARAFEQVQQLPKTISVLREIARLYGEQGNIEERARALKRIVALDPGDPEARQALAQLAGPKQEAARRDLPPPPGAVIEPSRAQRPQAEPEPEEDEAEIEAYEEDLDASGGEDEDDVLIVDEDDSPPSDEPAAVDEEPASIEENAPEIAPPVASERPRSTSLPPDVAREAFLAKLLTEVDVFHRYGLKQKVVEQLRRVLELEPRHLDARRRLKEVLVERGENDAAALELVALADMCAVEDPTGAEAYLREAESLDPNNPEVVSRLAGLSSSESSEDAADGFGDDKTIAGDAEEFIRAAEAQLAARAARPEPLQPANPDPPRTGAAPLGGLQARGPALPRPPARDAAISGGLPAVAAPRIPTAPKPATTTGPHAALPAPSPSLPKPSIPRPAAALPAPAASLPKPGLPRPGLPRPVAPVAAVAAPVPAPAPTAAPPVASAPSEPPEDIFFVDDEATGHGPPPDEALVLPPAPARSEVEVGEATASDERAFGPPATTDVGSSDFGPASATEAHSLASEGDPLAPMSPEEFESAPLHAVSAVDDPGRSSLPPGEVEEILDEAEFFVAQGLYDEGIGVLTDALAAHPRNRLLQDRIAELQELAERAEAALREASRPPPAVDNSFQLAEKLADEIEETSRREGSDVLDVEAVFAQFKKGVEEQVPVDDTDTHFDLGIAYKEMGLLNDAIHEFEICLANPARECMAHTMIGLCHAERGDTASAIGAFKKGLYAEKKTEREELGLYYELGRAYEAMHDTQEALYYFEKVKRRDPGFLDVQDRIDALVRPRSGANAVPTEDLDAAFDELMGKE